MSRLTTNNEVSNMGMYQLALNSCYIEDGLTRYRDFARDIDARDFARELMVAFGEWKKDGADTDNEIVDDDIFDDTMFDNLAYEPNTIKGLIALFYRNLWVMAELREKLKHYEDADEKGLLLKLPCKVGDTVYNIVPRVSEESTYREDKVTRIEIYDDSVWMCFHNGLAKNITRIGKSVFLTKEEAEQKLKEMESDK